MIYDVNGNAIARFYDVNDTEKHQAYDINGNPLITQTTDFRIMTYNVGSWYTGTSSRVPSDKKTQYYNLQYGTFDNNPVEVVLLQEYLSTWCVDDSPATELISPFYSYIQTTRPATVYQGHAICSNSPITNYAVHPFTSHGGNYPSFESGEIVVGGKTITFVNTHNDYSITYQSPEITELLDFISNLGSFILAGDFNINLSTQDTSDSQYYNNVTRFINAGYHVGNCNFAWVETYFRTSSPTGGKFTDTIITSADITIKNLYAYTEKLTDNLGDKIDHIPLIAELSI